MTRPGAGGLGSSAFEITEHVDDHMSRSGAVEDADGAIVTDGHDRHVRLHLAGADVRHRRGGFHTSRCRRRRDRQERRDTARLVVGGRDVDHHARHVGGIRAPHRSTPRIGSVNCSIEPIVRPPAHLCGRRDRAGVERPGLAPTGTNRAPESAASEYCDVEIHPNTSISTCADPAPAGVTIEIVDRPPAPTPRTARFGTASRGAKLTSDDSPGVAPVG
jgi:hypothetical protein